ncbi:hypothetical protein ACFL0Q_05025 [Thermodesulfobacteriota bacterium]
MDKKNEFDWFDKPQNIKRLWIFLYVFCGLAVVSEFFFAAPGHFGFDGFFGFYALLGFVACACLILISKVLGFFLKAKEGYYDD